MKSSIKKTAVLLVACLLVSCAPLASEASPTLLPTPFVQHVLKASPTAIPGPTRAPTWTPEPSPTAASLLQTPDPLIKYYIPALRVRQYGGGQLENLGVMADFDSFTRYSIRYPSDGLNIAGFMNLPHGDGPFPVIIALHGYASPAEYQTLDYTTGAADDLAAQGYIVLHPNLRNFQPSDSGDALFRAGYAIDVLNLIALVRENAGKPGLFEQANAKRIGLWGHSMGGDIALKVAEISPYVRAIVLYAGMGGDEQKNSQFFNFTTGNPDNQKELQASAQDFASISPDRFYKDITAAIQLHHGTGDTVIPVAWALETCQKLKEAGRQVQCFYYDGAEHTFRARYIAQYGPRMDEFFAAYLKK
ncbi:MAG TPA: alpha/beta fold hydrolase [Anaerolineales bacterium]|jgi:dienelactone hydrolase